MQDASSWTDGLQLAFGADQPRRMLIGGRWLESYSGQSIAVVDPSTASPIASIQRGTAADVDRAVAAARAAFEGGEWPAMNGTARERLMHKLADLIETNSAEFALLEALDGGKPIAAAHQADVLGSVARLRYAAAWAPRLNGQNIEPAVPLDMHCYTRREACGVAGLIVPWNFPLAMAVSKLGDALAAGCTVVLKPSELTSLATLRLGELIGEAGFPDGVVNIVTGYGSEAGQALADHAGVDKISFTGSTRVGKQLVRSAAGNLKRLTLELGGKSPAIVFADADLDLSVRGVLRNFTYNSGQICAAGSRIFVHRAVYEPFLVALADAASAVRVGPATEDFTEMGPLVSEAQRDRVRDYIAGAVESGATVVAGGAMTETEGYFHRPTILADTRPDMAVRREEIFGPVATISPFEGDEFAAVIREANDTDYGLSSYIYTRDLSAAHRTARLIRAGTVRINGAALDHTMPFGGYKQSGWGRENGCEGVLSFTELKTVMIALA